MRQDLKSGSCLPGLMMTDDICAPPSCVITSASLIEPEVCAAKTSKRLLDDDQELHEARAITTGRTF